MRGGGVRWGGEVSETSSTDMQTHRQTQTDTDTDTHTTQKTNLPELSVIPGVNHSACVPALNEVAAQVVVHTRPERGRQAAKRWHPPLVHVIKHTVIAGQNVLQFLRRHPGRPRTRDVHARVAQERAAVRCLELVKEGVDERLNGGRHGEQRRVGGVGVPVAVGKVKRKAHVEWRRLVLKCGQEFLPLLGNKSTRPLLLPCLEHRFHVGWREG